MNGACLINDTGLHVRPEARPFGPIHPCFGQYGSTDFLHSCSFEYLARVHPTSSGPISPEMRQWRVFWIHNELAFIILEWEGRFVVASLYEGHADVGTLLYGLIPISGICQLTSEHGHSPLWINIEGVDLSEVEVMDLLSQIRE